MQIKNKQKHKSTKLFAHSKQEFISYSGIYLINDIIGFQMGYWIS